MVGEGEGTIEVSRADSIFLGIREMKSSGVTAQWGIEAIGECSGRDSKSPPGLLCVLRLWQMKGCEICFTVVLNILEVMRTLLESFFSLV